MKRNPAAFLTVYLLSTYLFLFLYTPHVQAENNNSDEGRHPLSHTLTFCVKNSGNIFLIGDDFKKTNCKSNDRLVLFNLDTIINPSTVGLPGPKGDVGATGATGPQGVQGIQGPKGDKGDQGIQGEKGLIGDQGPIGLEGIQGLPGINGTNGTDGTNGTSGGVISLGWEKIESATTSAGMDKTWTTTCPGSKKVVGGGYGIVTGTVSTYYTYENFPSADNSWTVTVHRSSTATDWTLKVYAICVSTL